MEKQGVCGSPSQDPLLPEKQSCCSAAGDGTFVPLGLAQGTLLPGLDFTAASFRAAPVVSAAGRFEVG